MKRLMILLLAAAFLPLGAQNRTQNGVLTSQKKYPLLNYFELPQPAKPDPAQWTKVKGVQVSWGSADAAYAKTEVPAVKALRSTFGDRRSFPLRRRRPVSCVSILGPT